MRRSFRPCSLAPAPPCHCPDQSFAQRQHTAHNTRKAAFWLRKLAAIGGVWAQMGYKQPILVLGLPGDPRGEAGVTSDFRSLHSSLNTPV